MGRKGGGAGDIVFSLKKIILVKLLCCTKTQTSTLPGSDKKVCGGWVVGGEWVGVETYFSVQLWTS